MDLTVLKITVLKISDCYWPRVNGVSASMRAFSQGLSKLGADVVIIAPSYESDRSFRLETEGDVKILRVPAPPFPFHREDRMVIPSPLAVKRILRELKLSRSSGLSSENVIVHLETFFGMGLIGLNIARELGAPSVFTYHTLFEDYVHYIPLLPKGLLRRMARGYSRWFSQKVDLVIAPSSPIRDKLKEYGLRKRIEVLSSPISETFFSDPPEELLRSYIATLGLTGERGRRREKVALLVARLGREKSPEVVFKAFHILKEKGLDVKLIVAGDGPLRKELESWVKEKGLSDLVKFLGYLPQEDLKAIYQLSDIFLFASKTETQGLVLAEAMARGCVPIALRAQGVEDVITPSSGVLVTLEPGEKEEEKLADEAYKLLNDEERLYKLSVEAYNRGREFHPLSLSEKLLKIYLSILRGSDEDG